MTNTVIKEKFRNKNSTHVISSKAIESNFILTGFDEIKSLLN